MRRDFVLFTSISPMFTMKFDIYCFKINICWMNTWMNKWVAATWQFLLTSNNSKFHQWSQRLHKCAITDYEPGDSVLEVGGLASRRLRMQQGNAPYQVRRRPVGCTGWVPSSISYLLSDLKASHLTSLGISFFFCKIGINNAYLIRLLWGFNKIVHVNASTGSFLLIYKYC